MTLHHSLQLFLIKTGDLKFLVWFAAVVNPSSELSGFWSEDATQNFGALRDLMCVTGLNATQWVRQLKKNSELNLQSC